MKNYTAMIAGLALVGATFAMADNSSTQSAMAALDPDVIEGKDVMDASGKQLGDVDEVVQNSSNEHLAVIGLENSAKEVVVPIDRLSMSADGESLTTALSREELEALPDYDPNEMKSVPE